MNRTLATVARALVALLTPRPGNRRAGRLRYVALLLAAVALFAVATRGEPRPDVESGADAHKSGRTILSRPWFDRLPENNRENFHLWFWFGGGVGIHESGSRFRFSLDIFEFERKGSAVDMKYFADGKKIETGFKIERCDELPPFDLCLTFDKAPGDGPKKLYGFDYDDDLDSNVPWAAQARRAAEEQARGPRP
jgi:hypothetical protein